MQRLNKLQQGSTIIELLISLMVVGLVVTAVAATVTHSIKNAGEARFKQTATTLGQEVIEQARAEKTRLGFDEFRTAVGSKTYCLKTLPASFTVLPADGVCSGATDLISNLFFREVSFDISQSDSVDVSVVVSWNDGTNDREIQLEQQFFRPSF